MNIKQTSMHVIDKRNYHVYTIEIKGKNFKTSYKKNMCVCVWEPSMCESVQKSTGGQGSEYALSAAFFINAFLLIILKSAH